MVGALNSILKIAVLAVAAFASVESLSSPGTNDIREGLAAYGDWTSDAAGIRRRITASDLPSPYVSSSAANAPAIVARPADAHLSVPAGFEVKQFASGLQQPRLIRVAPNGDIFVAESGAGRIRVLRPTAEGDGVSREEVFASGLDLPFGIAFYPSGDNPQWIYVANTGSVVRFPYHNGDLRATDKPQVIVPSLPTGGNHWTRDIVFSADNSKMFVSVGSSSNDAETMGPSSPLSPRHWIAAARRLAKEIMYGAASASEAERADVLVFDPGGRGRQVYASGIRNCVGMAVDSTRGDLWCSTNERDGLGDDLPPDYITRIQEGGFYGWPWYYLGNHQDPRHKGKHPELADKIIVPDVLLQAHSASLCMLFYTAQQFPAQYHGYAFAAEHGSWNRARRTGYKIICVPVHDGKPIGEYDDFLTGFVVDSNSVWGRPVGVTVDKQGSLIITDDGGNCIWRVRYTAATGTVPQRSSP